MLQVGRGLAGRHSHGWSWTPRKAFVLAHRARGRDDLKAGPLWNFGWSAYVGLPHSSASSQNGSRKMPGLLTTDKTLRPTVLANKLETVTSETASEVTRAHFRHIPVVRATPILPESRSGEVDPTLSMGRVPPNLQPECQSAIPSHASQPLPRKSGVASYISVDSGIYNR